MTNHLVCRHLPPSALSVWPHGLYASSDLLPAIRISQCFHLSRLLKEYWKNFRESKWPGKQKVSLRLSADQCPEKCSGAHQLLCVDRQFGEGLNPRSILPQRIFHHAVVEARNDNIVPAVANAAKCNVQHGDDLIPEWLLAIEGDGPKEFLAFGVAGVVRAGVR